MKRVIGYLLFAGLVHFACKESAVEPWPGWNYVGQGRASFSLPPGVSRLEVDPNPRDVVGVWGDPGDTLLVYFYYKSGLEGIVQKYDSAWSSQQESISIGDYSGIRLRSTYRPANATQSSAIYVQWLGDGDIQLFLLLVYGQGQSAVKADRILQSLRIL